MNSRRSFLKGLGALIAAPAVVKVASLMPVRGVVIEAPTLILPGSHVIRTGLPLATWRKLYEGVHFPTKGSFNSINREVAEQMVVDWQACSGTPLRIEVGHRLNGLAAHFGFGAALHRLARCNSRRSAP